MCGTGANISKEMMKMLPLKKILCPTDFSEPSYNALKTANELALHFSAELIVVHVIIPIHFLPAPGDPEYLVSYKQYMETSVRRNLDSLFQAMISKEVKSHSTIVHGNPADEIVQTAAKENTDIIVIATHGLTGWRHLIFGSVAERVVRLAPCGVLTIRTSKAEMKKEYHEKMEVRLKKVTDRIQRLRSEHEDAGAETSKEHLDHIQELLATHETARRKLEELKAAADGEWETLKVGWEEVHKDLQDTLNHLISSF